MNYYSEQDIRQIVADVISRSGLSAGKEMEIPVEISARHIHLSRADKEALFGAGYILTRKRDLSQPGQYLCEERVKLVTATGEIANVAVLGPERKETQVELSLTDARILGLKPPVRLSGDLQNAADVIIVGPRGVITAKGSVIVAKAHVHMTPADAQKYGVEHGQSVSIRIGKERSVTLNDVQVRVSKDFALAVHIDYDEANAARVSGGNIVGYLRKDG